MSNDRESTPLSPAAQMTIRMAIGPLLTLADGLTRASQLALAKALHATARRIEGETSGPYRHWATRCVAAIDAMQNPTEADLDSRAALCHVIDRGTEPCWSLKSYAAVRLGL